MPVVCVLQKCIFLPLLFLCGTARNKKLLLVATSLSLANIRVDPGTGQGCVMARSTVSKNPSIKMYYVVNVPYTIRPSNPNGISAGYEASPISPDAANNELKGLDNTIDRVIRKHGIAISLSQSVFAHQSDYGA